MYEKIIKIYPQLSLEDFGPRGTIILQNDSDGKGEYIRSWSHPTLTQPTPEQLAAITS